MHPVIQQIAELMDKVVFKNTVESYAVALLTFFVLFFGLSVVKRFLISHLGKLAQKTASDLDDFILCIIDKIGWLEFTVLALYISLSSLIMPESAKSLVRYALVFVLTIRFIKALIDIIQYSVNKLFLKRIGSDNVSSQAMVKSVVWVIKCAVWVLGGVFILDNLGVNISALVAGIGIGGIAVAMASQAVLGDAFSALSIYLDKPFEIGDFIIMDDCMGNVEHIGIKTTRIRSLSGEQLVLANSDLTKGRVKNYKRMITRRIEFRINIRYETPVEKLEQIPDLIRGLLAQVDVNIDRVHFKEFAESALVFEVVYFVNSADYNAYMDKQQAFNLALIRAFDREGIHFAYPTRTMVLKSEPPEPEEMPQLSKTNRVL